MSSVDLNADSRRIEKYLSDLENANRKLALENSQLRASHSYRLGLAFVSFAKRRTISALPALWRDIKQAIKPQIVSAPQSHKRPPLNLPTSLQRAALDSLQKALEEPPIGSTVVANIDTRKPAVSGIMGGEIQAKLGEDVVQPNLPFDRYDAVWQEQGVTHLVIEVDQLPKAFGWEQVFTLRDPAATVEMLVMLQKARMARISTILVTPSQPHRFPLLSKARPFFDHEFTRSELMSKGLWPRGVDHGDAGRARSGPTT